MFCAKFISALPGKSDIFMPFFIFLDVFFYYSGAAIPGLKMLMFDYSISRINAIKANNRQSLNLASHNWSKYI